MTDDQRPERVSYFPGDGPPIYIPPDLDKSQMADMLASVTQRMRKADDHPIYPLTEGTRLTIAWPKSRWQRYKSIHKNDWWMAWLVRLRPVRYTGRKAVVEQVTYGPPSEEES